MKQTSYRSSASFGKRQEFVVIAELLKRNFDVYLTLVDDQGIDCIIRLNQEQYVDIQIKARSIRAKNWNRFAGMQIDPRDNYFFIFYIEVTDTFWIIPSKAVAENSTKLKSGENMVKYTLTFPKTDDSEKAKRFDQYKGDKGFELLRLQNN